jgi:DNA-binding transcriptional MerR regulator
MTDRDRRDASLELEAAARLAHLPVARVRRYIRVGLVTPRVEDRRPLFDETDVSRLRRIRRLADDLGINTAGVEVALNLIDRVEALQRELETRRCARRLGAGKWEARRWQQ